MGPHVVTMVSGPVIWAVLALSLVIGAMLAYEIAMAPPTEPIMLPRWPLRVVRFIWRWYPRVVLPILIALGWLWL